LIPCLEDAGISRQAWMALPFWMPSSSAVFNGKNRLTLKLS
jgi:hypothetical protein